jgi:P-type conjugative transfer protein TrbL
MSIGVTFVIFTHAQEWGQDIIATFQQIGGATTGMSPLSLTPTGVMAQGFQLAAIFWQASARASWFTAPSSAIEFMFCSLVIVISFACAALTFVEVLIESAAVAVGGSILLPFSTVRWLRPLLPGWASAVVALGVRLMFLLMVLSIGLVLANQWSHSMAGNADSITGNTYLAVEAMVESLFFALLTWKLPLKMAGYVDSRASASWGESHGAAMMVQGFEAAEAGAKRAGQASATVGKASAQVVQKMLLS